MSGIISSLVELKEKKVSKSEFQETLRKAWELAKQEAERNEVKAAYEEAVRMGVKSSITGFMLTKLQMDYLNYSGTPYIDTKTFMGWKESGFKVKRGQKSRIYGVTFLPIKDNEVSEDSKDFDYLVPKVYHLFHSSQVEPITQN